VLAALHVPIESKIVAMAKTSVQQYIITPQNPRMLYFNDSVAVGFVRGGFMELAAAQDPRQGIVFYAGAEWRQGNGPEEAKIRGAPGSAEKSVARGPSDNQGRSLRQFDLQHRLMRYPCSYVIYAEAFDALPEAAKNAIYERLWSVLSGTISGGKYARLSLPERKAVTEILRETKDGLPEYFTTVLK
jgi:hypothetical protein